VHTFPAHHGVGIVRRFCDRLAMAAASVRTACARGGNEICIAKNGVLPLHSSGTCPVWPLTMKPTGGLNPIFRGEGK
jgi:hypothetical protein